MGGTPRSPRRWKHRRQIDFHRIERRQGRVAAVSHDSLHDVALTDESQHRERAIRYVDQPVPRHAGALVDAALVTLVTEGGARRKPFAQPIRPFANGALRRKARHSILTPTSYVRSAHIVRSKFNVHVRD